MVTEQADQRQHVVRKRRVFYIPGYDPIHPRRYRELYRKEATEQARISGYDIHLKPKTTKGPYGWHVRGEIDGVETETDVEVLVWSDYVRDSMLSSIPVTYLQMVRTAWIYIGSGTLWRVMKLRKGPGIAALYPVGMLIMELVLAVLIARVILGVGASATAALTGIWAALAVGATWALAFAAAVGLLRWFRVRDGQFYVYYLMHNFAQTSRLRGAYPPELETRLSEFSDRIAQALDGDADEVLVVGHSSGAHLGVSVLADLIRSGRGPRPDKALAFLTLGQVVPMASFLPEAHRLRADLQFLSARPELTWIDVTAPGDGCAFALCDPVAVTGVAPPDQRWPLILSAAFTQTLSPARWAELRWRFFRLHFQYLCAFDRPGDYDYFRITAGPLTLADRFRGRQPSKSRLSEPVSRYRSVTA